jgi:hypothetical protein
MISPFIENSLIVAAIALSTAITNTLNDRRARKQSNKLDEVQAQAKDIHTLVNGQMGNVLRIGEISAQALYEKSPTDENFKLLDEAKNMRKEHEVKQVRAEGNQKETPK